MSEILKKEDGKVVISFSASAEEFNKGLDIAFKKVVKKVNAPGFRKGKLPRNVFNKMYGEESLYQDAIDSILQVAYIKALSETEVKPLTSPDIDVKEISKETGVKFEATILVKPEVKLGEYKNLKIEKEDTTATDEDVDNRIDGILSRQAEWSITEEASKKGDIVVIDFKGFIDGVAFEGGEATAHELELGSNSFIPGFEDQLVGKKAGEEVDVNVTFPAEYQVADLASKDAKFEVKIHDVKVKTLPTLDDAFVKDLTKGAAVTVDEYKATLKEEISKEKASMAEKTYADKVVRTAVENATVTVADKLVDQEVEDMFNGFKENMERQGLSMEMYEQFTGKKADDLKADMREEAANKIKTSFVIEEIAIAEKIEVTKEEMDKEIKEISEIYSISEEEIRQRIASGVNLESELLIKKTIEFLKEN